MPERFRRGGPDHRDHPNAPAATRGVVRLVRLA